MTLIELVDKFVKDIQPYLDDTFESVIVDFKKGDKNYQLTILDDSDFDEMMLILRDAYRKRYDNLSDEDKRKYN